jgi:hypothetical protein
MQKSMSAGYVYIVSDILRGDAKTIPDKGLVFN